jgi:hypothetical protein
MYYLEVPDDEGGVEVRIEGSMTQVPNGVILPRDLGLEVLQKANDFDRVLNDYSWREQ